MPGTVIDDGKLGFLFGLGEIDDDEMSSTLLRHKENVGEENEMKRFALDSSAHCLPTVLLFVSGRGRKIQSVYIP